MDWLIGTRIGEGSSGQMPGKLAFAAVMLGMALVMPAQVLADRQEEIISDLEAEGYTDITTSRTWLRRTKIVAEGEAGRREIVIDPRNDEILRDYTRPAPDGPPPGGKGRPGHPPPGGAPPDGPPPSGAERGGGPPPGGERGGGPGPSGDRPDPPSGPGPSDHGPGGEPGGEAPQ